MIINNTGYFHIILENVPLLRKDFKIPSLNEFWTCVELQNVQWDSFSINNKPCTRHWIHWGIYLYKKVDIIAKKISSPSHPSQNKNKNKSKKRSWADNVHVFFSAIVANFMNSQRMNLCLYLHTLFCYLLLNKQLKESKLGVIIAIAE